MAYFSAAKTAMLNALSFTASSLHSAYPGSTGANEIAGVTRQTPSVATESGGVRVGATNTWSVPAGSTVRWQGWWNGANFMCCAPNGGNPKEFVVVPSSDTVYSPAHGYGAGQKVVFWNGTVPGGITEGTVYFVVNPTTDTFQVSTTSGGSVLDITSAGTSAVLVSAITEDAYPSAGSHTISSATFGLPL